MNSKNEYKSILKITSIFGYVQIVTLINGVIRSKLVASWLGTQGVGILGLVTSTLALIVAITNIGLPVSIVKYLAKGAEDEKIANKIKIVKFSLWITGFLGAVLTLIFDKSISFITFNSYEFTWAFQLISISVLLRQLFVGFSSILQSLHLFKKLANVNLIANSLGLLVAVPIYYFYKIDGIFYNILIMTVIEVLVIFIAFRKIKHKPVQNNSLEYKKEVKPLLTSGLTFSFTGIITLLALYLIQIFITKEGSFQEVGIYTASYTILNSYVGIVFQVMSYEYYPRLMMFKDDILETNLNVNKQLYLGLLIVMPILLLVILSSNFIINILYNSSFFQSSIFIIIASIGILFKVFSWTIGYVIITKASNRLIIQNSVFYNILFVLFHILGYYFYGVIGMAFAFSIYYFVHFAGNFILIRKYFSFKIDKKNILFFSFFFIFLLINVMVSLNLEGLLKYIINGLSFVLVSSWSLNKIIKIFR